MNPDCDVISDFLDGDAFEPKALGEALANPDGRDMLVDFILLRYAVRTETPRSASTRPAARGRLVLAAAVAGVALFGGYQIGSRHADASPSPPEATRVVQAPGWQMNGGGN